MSDISIDKI